MKAQDDVGRLYVSLGRINRMVRREHRDAPIGHGALSALASLTAGGPMRLGALADTEGVSPPSMTRIIDTLEELGYARRTVDPADGRACLIEASNQGRRLVQAGRATRLTALHARVDALSSEDRAALRAAIPALEALAAVTATPADRPSHRHPAH